MMQIDMIQTLAVGVAALVLGGFLNRRIGLLRRICIPAPVTGGILVSLLALPFRSFTGVQVDFDCTLKDVCMLLFFTSVGFQCDLGIIRRGGRKLVMMVTLVALLIVMQNILGVAAARLFGAGPLLGISAGSITMCGGHGTAAGFSDVLESGGLRGAAAVTMAAATFGLIAGSLMGGPLGSRLIKRYKLSPSAPTVADMTLSGDSAQTTDIAVRIKAVCLLSVTAAAGTLLNKLFLFAGITVPTYLGALLTAIAVRNLIRTKLPYGEAVGAGSIFLALFLGVAMATLDLHQLSGIALPLLGILSLQIVLMYVLARFIAFPLLGRDYDAAVLVGGLCGFGLGATPNALANMDSVCASCGRTSLPFIIVPVVGAAFVDLINVTVITLFLNFLG